MLRSKIAPRTLLTAAILLPLLGTGAPAETIRPQHRIHSAPSAETLGEPPADYNPRKDPEARSPASLIFFDPYLSVQVNVAGLGANIIGDAANEPSIAVNPNDPDSMVIGWRQFDNIASDFRQAGVGYTLNGGTIWTFPGPLDPGIFRSDPVLDTDSAGNFYYQSLRFISSLDLSVFKSTDGGVTWSPPVPEFGGDKNWMAIDKTGGVGEGHIYGIWQRFGGACCGLNVLTRSTDGGASYETPVPMAFSPTFGTLAVGPDGELYAAGIDGTSGQDLTTFVVSRSLDARDAGMSPTSVGVQVPLGGSMGFGSGPNPGGLLGQANVAVDHSSEPTRGNVYLLASVVPDSGTDPMDVHFTRSTDGGQTWSPFVRVNDDASTQNWQWFGALSVAPNGRIDVIWNDTRNSGVENVSQLFYAYSYDGGDTWSANVAVSPAFDSHVGWPQQTKIGDYYTLVSGETGADVAYSATFNGEQDVYYVRVFPDCNGNGISDEIDLSGGTSPDCDGNGLPDECQLGTGGAGSVPDGGLVPGTPLTISTETGFKLSWGESCSADDTDYVVYEGVIGFFTSHAARRCSTGGETTLAMNPLGADTYYLVAPVGQGFEGSLGRDSHGKERPPGPNACLPQQILTCCLAP
jgi:hypothetical protein